MNRDSAAVIFCTIACIALICWKSRPFTSPIITPEAEDQDKPVPVSGPAPVRPVQFAAAPYIIAPAFRVTVQNRASQGGSNGC